MTFESHTKKKRGPVLLCAVPKNGEWYDIMVEGQGFEMNHWFIVN